MAATLDDYIRLLDQFKQLITSKKKEYITLDETGKVTLKKGYYLLGKELTFPNKDIYISDRSGVTPGTFGGAEYAYTDGVTPTYGIDKFIYQKMRTDITPPTTGVTLCVANNGATNRNWFIAVKKNAVSTAEDDILGFCKETNTWTEPRVRAIQIVSDKYAQIDASQKSYTDGNHVNEKFFNACIFLLQDGNVEYYSPTVRPKDPGADIIISKKVQSVGGVDLENADTFNFSAKINGTQSVSLNSLKAGVESELIDYEPNISIDITETLSSEQSTKYSAKRDALQSYGSVSGVHPTTTLTTTFPSSGSKTVEWINIDNSYQPPVTKGDLTVTKTVQSDNDADKQQLFSFHATINGQEQQEFTLSNGQSKKWTDLSEGDTYTVVEKLEDGYTTEINGVVSNNGTATGTLAAGGTVLSYRNKRNDSSEQPEQPDIPDKPPLVPDPSNPSKPKPPKPTEEIPESIIPSKYIYEIDNQKVIDNEVDNIEVGINNNVIVTETKSVYSQQITSSYKSGGKEYSYAHEEKSISGLATMTYTAVAYADATPKYDTATITIPKNIGNMGILRLLTGQDDNGYANIKYSLRGTTRKGTITGSATCVSQAFYGVSFQNFSIIPPQSVSEETDVQYSVSPEIEYTQPADSSKGNVTATLKFTISDKSNILTAKAVDSADGNSYVIDLTFLSGMVLNKAGGSGLVIPNGSTQIDLTGDYEEYTPTQIDVSFDGDVLSLDTKDKTIKFGDGSHVYSFEGNELMQGDSFSQKLGGCAVVIGTKLKDSGTSGNWAFYKVSEFQTANKNLSPVRGDGLYYQGEYATVDYHDDGSGNLILCIEAYTKGKWAALSGQPISVGAQWERTYLENSVVKNNYEEILADWRNGKETAKIRCALADYYCEPIRDIKITTLSVSEKSSSKTITFQSDILLKNEDELNVKNVGAVGAISAWVVSTTAEPHKYQATVPSEEDVQINYVYYADCHRKNISLSNSALPMTFHVGDIVIPYIYGANGKDKPMSLYKNGLPKKFLVVGEGITGDGAISQEITIQEITQK